MHAFAEGLLYIRKQSCLKNAVCDLDLSTNDLHLPVGDIVYVLVRIFSVVQELPSSQAFYGHRCVTLTFKPMTWKISVTRTWS